MATGHLGIFQPGFIPALKSHCILSICRQLITEEDTIEAIKICLSNDSRNDDKACVNRKIERFEIPKELKYEVRYFVSFMLSTLKKWLQWGNRYFNEIPYENFFQASCLTCFGTVDQKKSIEKILQNENINIVVQFKLACISCLETYVEKIWQRLSEEGVDSLEFLSQRNNMYLLRYWMNNMNGIMNGSDVEYFRSAVRSDFQLAAVFFWNKCSLQDQQKILNEIHGFWRIEYVNTLLLVLPYVEHEIRKKYASYHIIIILRVLQDPPWRLLYSIVIAKLLEWIEIRNYVEALIIAPIDDCFREVLLSDFLASYLQVPFDNNRESFCEIILLILKHKLKKCIHIFRRYFDTNILFSNEFIQLCVNKYVTYSFDEEILGNTLILIGKCVDSEERRNEWVDRFVQEALAQNIPRSSEDIKEHCMTYIRFSETDEISNELLMIENLVQNI